MHVIKKIFPSLNLFAAIIFFFLSFVVIVSATWNPPTSTPPNNNSERPVNLTNENQVKRGPIGANVIVATNRMQSPRYCDASGSNCFRMSALYKCPYINRASEHSFNEGFCASTCIGQIGFATTCKDYEQLRVGEGDRRCEVRQTFNCFLIGVPAIYNDGYWWASDVWTNSGEPYNATCGSRSFKRPCVLQRQTRIVQCRDFMTQVVITEDRCPQMMSGDQNLLKPLDFRSIEIP